MRPYISNQLCKQCGECIAACPYDVMQDEHGFVKVSMPEDCIECGTCVDVCPHKAVYMDD